MHPVGIEQINLFTKTCDLLSLVWSTFRNALHLILDYRWSTFGILFFTESLRSSSGLFAYKYVGTIAVSEKCILVDHSPFPQHKVLCGYRVIGPLGFGQSTSLMCCCKVIQVELSHAARN